MLILCLSYFITTVHTDKSKVKISQNYAAFSEYMNFKHMNFEDDKKSEKSMGGKLTLPNIKDCTSSKYDYLLTRTFFCARTCASIWRRRDAGM